MLSKKTSENEDDYDIKIKIDNKFVTVNDYFEINNIPSNLGNEEVMKAVLDQHSKDNFALSFVNNPDEDTQTSFIDKPSKDDARKTQDLDEYKMYVSSKKYILKKYWECEQGIKNLSLYFYANNATFLNDIKTYFLENMMFLYCNLKNLLMDTFVEMYRYYHKVKEIYPHMIDIMIAGLEMFNSDIEKKCYETILYIKNTYGAKPNRAIYNKCIYLFHSLYKLNIKRNLRKYMKVDEEAEFSKLEDSGSSSEAKENEMLNDRDESENILDDDEESKMDRMTLEEIAVDKCEDFEIEKVKKDDVRTRVSIDTMSESEESFNMSRQMNSLGNDISLNKIISLNFIVYLLRHDYKAHSVIVEKHKNIVKLILSLPKITMPKYKYVFLSIVFYLNCLIKESKITTTYDKHTIQTIYVYAYKNEQYYEALMHYYLNYLTYCSNTIDDGISLNDVFDTVIGKDINEYQTITNTQHYFSLNLAQNIVKIYENKYYNNTGEFYNLIYRLILLRQNSTLETLFENLIKIADSLSHDLFNQLNEKLCKADKELEEINNAEESPHEEEKNKDFLLELLKSKNLPSLSMKVLKFLVKLLASDLQALDTRLELMKSAFPISQFLQEYISIADILLSNNKMDVNFMKVIVNHLKETPQVHLVFNFLRLFADGHYIKDKIVEAEVLLNLCEKSLGNKNKWFVQKQSVNILFLVWQYNPNYRKAIFSIFNQLSGNGKYKTRSLICEFYMLVLTKPEFESKQFEFIDNFYYDYVKFEKLDINREFIIFRLEKLMKYLNSEIQDYDLENTETVQNEENNKRNNVEDQESKFQKEIYYERIATYIKIISGEIDED